MKVFSQISILIALVFFSMLGSAKVALPSESIFNLNSKWTNQDGTTLSLADLRGKKIVLVMAYTSCEHACPLLIEDMKKIESKIEKPDDWLFAFFSFDSERDTPAKLKSYAEKRKLKLGRWELFNGDKKAVSELAAALGVRYEKDEDGDFDHSNIISLVDPDGVVRFQQTGLNQDPGEFLTKAKALMTHRLGDASNL